MKDMFWREMNKDGWLIMDDSLDEFDTYSLYGQRRTDEGYFRWIFLYKDPDETVDSHLIYFDELKKFNFDYKIDGGDEFYPNYIRREL